MDLLITLIGNAVVDPNFRESFLAHAEETADRWGFHLTKGEHEMMRTVFMGFNQREMEPMKKAFSDLGDMLYDRLQPKAGKGFAVMPAWGCGKPCGWSVYPPPEEPTLRKQLENPAA